MSVLRTIINAILTLLGVPPEKMEDVLDRKAAESKQKLDWRNSIVDLMKLIGEDSSFSARKKLAIELGYTGNLDDSAAMNIWLHARVMERLRAEGL